MFGNKMDKIQKAVEKKKEAPLLKLVTTNDKEIKLAAMAGLGKVGTDDGFNALIPLLHDPDAEVRAAAASALAEMGNVHAKAHISAQANKETDEKAKQAMNIALSKIKNY